MVKKVSLSLFLSLSFLYFPGSASAVDIEKDLSRELASTRKTVILAGEKLASGAFIASETGRLKASAENIRAIQLLLQERFKLRQEKSASVGAKAAERHENVAEGVLKALGEYLALIDAIPPDGAVSQSTLDSLKQLIDKIAPPRKRPLLGTLPYKHLNYPSREPATTPAVVPAYRGGNRNVVPEDTAASAEAPIPAEITELAQSLQWNPVLIYEWVKNNVRTEWYWGVMKGAEETLQQKSGNDADQAALLTALLRASGFPTRFVKGTIEFFPDIEKAKSLIGISDPMGIAAFFQKSGIPFKPVIAGGGIANFQVEHIWVETFIPYSNYRGAVIDDHGKTWLALDTSIKPPGLSWNAAQDIPDFPFDALRDEYLQSVRTETPLEFAKAKVEEYLNQNLPGKAYQDLLATSAIIPEVLKIVPASLQFKTMAITGEYTELPADLRHQVKFTATGSAGSELFTVTLDAMRLSNQRVALFYEPETVEDQQIIDSYGGLDNTPSYLVRLRPVLKVNGERMVVAQDGLPMGAEYNLAVEVISPNGTERIGNTYIVGNLAVIGVVSQMSTNNVSILEEDDAETILFKEAESYVKRWNQAEEELASLLKLAVSRPIPTIVTVGGLIDVTYLLDIPHGFEWKGVFMDAGLRGIETVTRTGDSTREKTFMRLSALQGSILENRVFEDDFNVDSISTAKLLAQASASQIPLVIIDRTNIDTLLPTLSFDENIKTDITNAVNQNLVVSIPSAEMSYLDWSGISYLKQNPETGESGWMLSGGIAGGMTAARAWANAYLLATLGTPNTKSNKDKLSAARIMKIPVTDRQEGKVGTGLKEKLAVLVIDNEGKPVEGASVTFRVIAGGGSINGTQTVTTGRKGIAGIDYKLGEKTSDNAIFFRINPQDEQLTQVGLNLVTASVESRNGAISLLQPFEAYGFPSDPVTIIKGFGDGTSNIVNNPAGSLMVKVVDAFGNPASNVTMQYESVLPLISKSDKFTLPPAARNIQFYRPETCTNQYPLFGECPTFGTVTQKTGFQGCFVNTILGNTVNTQYTVKVSSPSHPQLAPVNFTLSTEGYREDGQYLPHAMLIRYLEAFNASGQRVNSTRVGSKLKKPLTSELFLVIDDYTMSGQKTCTKTVMGVDITYSCWSIIPSGISKIQRVPDGTVSYQVTAGGGTVGPTINGGNGKYYVNFTAGLVPEANTITAVGNAVVTVPEVLLDPDTGKAMIDGYAADKLKLRDISMQSSKQVLFSKETKNPVFGDTEKLTNYLVYGIDVTLSMNPSVIHITKDGFAKRDTAFTYTILPAEYNGMITDIEFFTKDEANIDLWAGSIPGDKYQGQGTSTMLAGSQWDIRKQNFAQAVLNNGSDIEIRGDRIPIPIGLGALVPDYNHDRKIDDSDRDRAELGDTYYFWVNDDDGSGDTEGTGIPGTRPYPLQTSIPGTRDLVDWFPVHLDIKELFGPFPPSVYSYSLNAAPTLRYVQTDLAPAESGTYLTDVQKAKDLIGGQEVKVVPWGTPQPLDAGFLQSIADGGKGIILIEAVLATKSPLQLQIYGQAGNKVYEASLNLSIDGVEQMFRHANLIQRINAQNAPAMETGFVGEHHAKGGEKDRLNSAGFANKAHFEGFDAKNDDKFFILLHGLNVNGQDARGWHSEMFKRLYWAGSKARFLGVSWYSFDGPSWDYYPNAVHAFETAEILGPKLKEAVGNSPVTIMAHSLGNMVVSSYLADHYPLQIPADRLNVINYLLFNAAVGLEAYLGDYTGYAEGQLNEQFDSSNQMIHSDWFGYQRRFGTSEWHQLFDSGDSRRKLSWRNRFAALPEGIKYVNFYSTAEDVLATYDGTQPKLSDLVSFNASRNAWVLQEKWKGLPLGLAGSEYMGWGFNLTDDEYNPATGLLGQKVHISAGEANSTITDNEQLKTRPFFLETPIPGLANALFTNSTVVFDTLKPYYNKLLVYAIPALTTPTGGWAGGSFDRFRVGIDGIDMNSKKSDSTWPRNKKEWWHSDIKDVAFLYTFAVIDDLTIKGDLK
ncbi:MAG: hypothetical protein FD174_883 [Geobacteraceae bacterium]|nr:MAG: hypothetical protein FD174_883 [Geobacteraceae bacterium]